MGGSRKFDGAHIQYGSRLILGSRCGGGSLPLDGALQQGGLPHYTNAITKARRAVPNRWQGKGTLRYEGCGTACW
jgi:hypothetical protein